MARLLEYPWPGNVRELEHVIERAALLSEPPRLRIPPFSETTLTREPALGAPRSAAPAPVPQRREWVTLEEAERRYVREVLHHVGGRVNGAGGAAEVKLGQPRAIREMRGCLVVAVPGPGGVSVFLCGFDREPRDAVVHPA